MYLASDSEGSGPWIHSLDVDRRIPQRVSFGIDRYTSLAASADGRRLVATLASPQRARSGACQSPATRADTVVGPSYPADNRAMDPLPRLGRFICSTSPRRVPPTASGSCRATWPPRYGARRRAASLEGRPSRGMDGRIAFSVRQNGQTLLYVANRDGTDVRVVSSSLELQGAPAWTPDGQSITVAAVVDSVPRLFNVPLDGRSTGALWRSTPSIRCGRPTAMFVFSGPDIGTTFQVKAAKADGSAYRLPKLTLTRGARHLSFMPGRRSIVVLRGEIRHKDLWLIDLETGAEHQLTDLLRTSMSATSTSRRWPRHRAGASARSFRYRPDRGAAAMTCRLSAPRCGDCQSTVSRPFEEWSRPDGFEPATLGLEARRREATGGSGTPLPRCFRGPFERPRQPEYAFSRDGCLPFVSRDTRCASLTPHWPCRR